MTTFDGKAFGQEIVAEVRGFMERELATIKDRLAALEAKQAKGTKPVVRLPARTQRWAA